PLLPGAVPAQWRQAESLRHRQRCGRSHDGCLQYGRPAYLSVPAPGRASPVRDCGQVLPGGIRRFVLESPMAGRSCHANLAWSEPAAPRPKTPPGVVCGDRAVNTIQPQNQPYFPGTGIEKRLPALTAPNIGDELSGGSVGWAWYAGGWSNAAGNVGAPGWSNGKKPTKTGGCPDSNAFATAVWPNCPDKLFQFHHQPFNYFANYAPGTDARAAHLRDEQEFLDVA